MKRNECKKSIYCFGAGKQFEIFVRENYDLCIEGVLDNYPGDKKEIMVEGRSYPIIPFSDYVPIDYSKIIITNLHAESMLEQIISDSRFANVHVEIASNVLEKLDISQDELMSKVIAASNNIEEIGNQVQIREIRSNTPIAGSKALSDVSFIAEKNGYIPLSVHLTGDTNDLKQKWRFDQSKQEYNKIYEIIKPGTNIIVQHPFRLSDPAREECFTRLKREKKVKIIGVVHDVEVVRNIYMSSYMKHEFEFMLQTVDIFIVHNDIMKEFFLQQGIEDNRIVVLEIFDYICDELENFDKQIIKRPVVYAGNLMLEKSSFLKQLKEISTVSFFLYGPNYDDSQVFGENIFYQGSYPSEEVPSKLVRGFGLVWDGDDIDSCSGDTGNYLRYNNPHKLSLYLASGIPVIIWKYAACASFVESNRVGILVESLWDLKELLSNIQESEYQEYENNARILSERLRKGFYLSRAIGEAEKRIKECL